MISYCVHDAGARANGGDGAVDRLAKALRAAGISVFVGEPALTAGMLWAETIEKAIKECKVFVALCTPTYGESEASNWTYRELHTADRLRKPILAVWHSGPFPPPSVKSFLSGVHRVPQGSKPLTDSTVAFDVAVAELLGKLTMLGVQAVSSAGSSTVEGPTHAAISEESLSIPELIAALKDGTGGQKEEAGRALANLAKNKEDNQIAIAAAGGIAPLVALVQRGNDRQKEEAARALGNLAEKIEDNQIAIAAAGGIAPLVALVQSGNHCQKEWASRALGTLAEDNEDNQITIAEAGGIAPLVALVQSGNEDQKEGASWALGTLARKNDNQIAIAAAGSIAPLVVLVRSGSDRQKECAVGALRNLAENNEDNQSAIAAAGGIA
eukprot:CAMPEP_0113272132 /NCGR_PEP_ID=MMETSP0008_2-20120614/23155_1 /TAXON_ID=97485 /ORGANISM="Prymnesium parvum" /LENGTH=382 /DNA_ID=CAMNT_0000121563 /DNA_START=1 /DNA_END=1146 /DNA_ORIENTATION=- /assembly_acc=CAM_ASM_000153